MKNLNLLIIAVACVALGGALLYPVLSSYHEYQDQEEYEGPDAEYNGTYWKEGVKGEGELYQKITVYNVGDRDFPIRMSDWNIECDDRQYAPNAFKSIFNGYSEMDLKPGNAHTFTLIFDVHDGAGENGCILWYVGDKNVEYRAE